jgi:hypothetical protein
MAFGHRRSRLHPCKPMDRCMASCCSGVGPTTPLNGLDSWCSPYRWLPFRGCCRPAPSFGLVVAEGQLLGDHPLRPGHFAEHQPPGLIVLHPPSSTLASIPEYKVASGCVFLPGLPYLGLDHRAAWVEADVEGTVTQLISKVGIDPQVNADTAALAMLLAA